MRKKIQQLILLVLPGLAMLPACHPSEYPTAPRVYQGVVLKNMCGCIAVQFTDGTALGQVAWVDGFDSSRVYDHVFRVANHCTWNGGPAADTINFVFNKPSEPQNCFTCMAYTPTPDTAYYISVLPR